MRDNPLNDKQWLRLASLEQALRVPHAGVSPEELTAKLLQTAGTFYDYLTQIPETPSNRFGAQDLERIRSGARPPRTSHKRDGQT